MHYNRSDKTTCIRDKGMLRQHNKIKQKRANYIYIEPKIKTFIQFEYVLFKLRSTWKIFPSYIEFYTMQNTYFVLNISLDE